jgi:hypothetical protein
VARSALSYHSRKLGKDARVIERMKELSAQYPRYGYRRIRIFLGRGGYRMSPGRAYRLWRAAGLQLPRKRPRKRVAAARPRPQAPRGPNEGYARGHAPEHDGRARNSQRRIRLEPLEQVLGAEPNFQANLVHHLLAPAPGEHDERDSKSDQHREPERDRCSDAAAN